MALNKSELVMIDEAAKAAGMTRAKYMVYSCSKKSAISRAWDSAVLGGWTSTVSLTNIACFVLLALSSLIIYSLLSPQVPLTIESRITLGVILLCFAYALFTTIQIRRGHY